MGSFDQFKAQRQEISAKTTNQFAELVSLFAEAISLLVDASEILEIKENVIEHQTAEGASKTAVWRFLSTLPTSAAWCYEAAISGDYGIAKNILRLTLEETVKLAYYATYPNKALRQIISDRDADETDIANMMKELNFEHRSGLMRLHGDLSAFYSHANLNLPVELIFAEESVQPLLGGGPRFIPELFEPILHQLLILLANAMKHLLIRFPVVLENPTWLTRFEKHILAVADTIPGQNEILPD